MAGPDLEIDIRSLPVVKSVMMSLPSALLLKTKVSDTPAGELVRARTAR
jgi:hypothetical protein